MLRAQGQRPARSPAWAALPIVLLVGCGPTEPTGVAPQAGAPSAIPAAAAGAVGASFEAQSGPARLPREPSRERARPLESPFGTPAPADEGPDDDLPAEPEEPQGVNL